MLVYFSNKVCSQIAFTQFTSTESLQSVRSEAGAQTNHDGAELVCMACLRSTMELPPHYEVFSTLCGQEKSHADAGLADTITKRFALSFLSGRKLTKGARESPMWVASLAGHRLAPAEMDPPRPGIARWHGKQSRICISASLCICAF